MTKLSLYWFKGDIIKSLKVARNRSDYLDGTIVSAHSKKHLEWLIKKGRVIENPIKSYKRNIT